MPPVSRRLTEPEVKPKITADALPIAEGVAPRKIPVRRDGTMGLSLIPLPFAVHPFPLAGEGRGEGARRTVFKWLWPFCDVCKGTLAALAVTSRGSITRKRRSLWSSNMGVLRTP
jgi:hypothetical protein